jgi:hypothetical protein
MPGLPELENRCLYRAAKKNDLVGVIQYLEMGVLVVDIRQNGEFSEEASFHTYGFDESIYLSSALHYALKHRNLEMVARLAKSVMDNNIIDDALYQYAAYLDKSSASPVYAHALKHPDDVLQKLDKNPKLDEKGVTQKQNVARNVDLKRETDPFKSCGIDHALFLNAGSDDNIRELNAAISVAYLQARELYDNASRWTIKKKEKAFKIMEQLVYLQSLYRNASPTPDVASYFSDTSSGNSLTELLRAKRVPNPFVMFAGSWGSVQNQLPEIAITEPPPLSKTVTVR